jgi:hypothetical protein
MACTVAWAARSRDRCGESLRYGANGDWPVDALAAKGRGSAARLRVPRA